MQTEVATLPTVSSNECEHLIRKVGHETKITTTGNVQNQSTSKSAAILLSKRKYLHPLLGGPYYKNNARIGTLSDSTKQSNKNPVGQRVLSANMLRVKQLQNQLTDAHCHLNELINENRLLKALQKRQDSALRRYEGTNAELPRIINSHHEELRVLQTKYKKLKAQHKDTCNLLKEKENELHTLQAQNKHLMQLSKDRNLGEREKLQIQVSDLNHRIKEQNNTIQLLHRKLALEGKSLRHQLHNEVAKHKETQQNLSRTMEKLKAIEELLDNREKKMFHNNQLPVFGKRKNIASQSLTNLADASNTTKLMKSVGNTRDVQHHNLQDKSLPTLTENEPVAKSKLKETNTCHAKSLDSLPMTQKTETMASLESVRKFRLQNSLHKLSARERLRERSHGRDVENNEKNEESFEGYERQDKLGYDTEVVEHEEHSDNKSSRSVYELPQELRKEFDYSTGESDDEKPSSMEREEYGIIDPTVTSKELHAKLTGTNLNNSQSTKESRETEGTKIEVERFGGEKLKFKMESIAQIVPRKSTSKADNQVELKRLRAVTDISESDSEDDKELESQRNQEKYSFILTNAPNDSEDDDPRHTIEDFLKFDINQSDLDSDVDSQNKRRQSMKSEKFNDSNFFQSIDGKVSKLAEDKYENGKQRLMDISKSWSELQEKIMREREASENEIKALENELKNDVVLEKKKSQKLDEDQVKKSLLTTDTTWTLSMKDALANNIEEKLLQLDKRSKTGSQLRRHSFSQDVVNFKVKNNQQLENNDQCIGKSFENKTFQRRQSTLDLNTQEEMETVNDKNLFSFKSDIDNDMSSDFEKELNDIDTMQAKLENSVAEVKKETNSTHHSKTSSAAAMPRTVVGTLRVDNATKLNNAQQESDLLKKDKPVQNEPGYKEEMSSEAKMISYNKEKLLAAMKAIDNNDNVEFLEVQKSQRSGGSSRSQITENLYRGIPTHTKKKDDLIKELFGDSKGDTKIRNGCTKLH